MRKGSLCGMLGGASSKGHMQREGEGAVVLRQVHLIAVVGTFLIGCAFLLLVVGCAGTNSEAPQEKEKGHTEASKEQTHSPEATEAEEEARCEGTGTTKNPVPGSGGGAYTTNDLPGC